MTMNRLYDMSTLEAKMKISMSTEMSMVQFRNGNIGKMKETQKLTKKWNEQHLRNDKIMSLVMKGFS